MPDKIPLNKRQPPRKMLLQILAVTALFAGIINGFLGTGGGIIIMLALGFLEIGGTGDDSLRDRFATVIAVILPLSVISTFSYGDKVNFHAASGYILPGILGGIVGAFLLDKISVKFVKRLFSIMVIWAGINFLIK